MFSPLFAESDVCVSLFMSSCFIIPTIIIIFVPTFIINLEIYYETIKAFISHHFIDDDFYIECSWRD